MRTRKLPTDLREGAQVSFPLLTVRSKHSPRPGYSAATQSIIACSLCCVQNYTLMMYFHATVPRRRLGNSGLSTGEGVRHVNVWKNKEWGKGKYVFLFLKVFLIRDRTLKILVLFCVYDECSVLRCSSKAKHFLFLFYEQQSTGNFFFSLL